MGQPECHVLVIEDEPAIRRFLRASLAEHGFKVREADTGGEGLHLAETQPPDLVILDLGLPDMDGQEVLRRLREWCRIPVIILSARDQEASKVQALDNGADDYITKPFGIGEMLARIRASLRRYHGADPESATLVIGEISVDVGARTVRRKGEEVRLTPLEYKLLLTLMHHAGKVLTHRFLLREVWGPGNLLENHHLRVFVAGLRRKIEEDPARPRHILTDQGVGYRFAAE